MGGRKGFITSTSNKTSVDLEVKSPATLHGQTATVITIRPQNHRSLKKKKFLHAQSNTGEVAD